MELGARAERDTLRRIGVVVFVGLLVLRLASRMFALVDRYAVNLLFSDQWNVYQAILDGRSWTDLFLWQHGPHRQGAAFLLTREIAEWTRWNTRAESYAIATAIVLACVVALLVSRSVFGSLSLWDACVPLLFLTLTQYEILLQAPNLSVSAGPLLLLMLYALGLTIRHDPGRAAALAILTLLVVFSGYGFLIWPMSAGLALLELRAAITGLNRRAALLWGSLILVLLAIGWLFIHGRVPATGADCFVFPDDDWIAYPTFMSIMFANYFGVRWGVHGLLALAVGGSAIVALIVAVGRGASRMWKRAPGGPDGLVVFALGGFTLLFAAGAAVGRMCMGLGFAESSRYSTLMIPGAFALYLASRSIESRVWRRIALSLLTVVAVAGASPWRSESNPTAERWRSERVAWVDCYLETADVRLCGERSGTSPHPNEERIRTTLEALERRELHLFARD